MNLLISMDAATLGQYSGYIAMVIAMGAMVIGVCNKKKIVSRCCGRKLEASLDIGAVSPPTPPEPKETRPDIIV